MRQFQRGFVLAPLIWVLLSAPVRADNEWVKLDQARIGSRGDPALVYDTAGKRFLCLGGGIAWPNYPEPHPYDDLALDLAASQWENLFPPGKDWGPKVGDSKAPGFKDEHFALADKEGNVRPNLSTYRGVNYYNQYAYDSDSKRVFFHARGHTFSYDPVARTWKDLAPPKSPAGEELLLWGSMCYDPVNKRVLLFGGGNVQSERGDPGTWTYDPAKNAWTQLEFRSAVIDGPRQKSEALETRAKSLAEATRARYFRAELPEQKKIRLDELAKSLSTDVAALRAVLAKTQSPDKHELHQLAWAIDDVDKAEARLAQAQKLLAADVNREGIRAAEAVKDALHSASDALALQPPQRALSHMVYDAARKQIVLFGGDQLDRLLADTWVFDCASQRWLEKRPAVGPSPRGGHALVYLPKSQKVLLFGGYSYTSNTEYCQPQYKALPFEMWAYDLATNEWSLLKNEQDAKSVPYQHAFYMSFTTHPAAANENDLVMALGQQGGTQPHGVTTWTCQVDPSLRDLAGTTRQGVKPGTFTHRKGPFVPSFFDDAEPPDAAAAEARLKELPANTWTAITPERRPDTDRCWGTAVYSPDHDAIMHWSGGHSSHCGTEVVCYHPGLNRWSLATASEQPLEFVYTNDQTPGQWSFQGRPWMTGHTYRGWGYDPVLKRMLFAGKGDRTYFFDPADGDWERRTTPNLFDGGMYMVNLCSTPRGLVAWSYLLTDRVSTGLWQMDGESRKWQPLPLKGKLPPSHSDQHGQAYDSKRERLLFFHATERESLGEVTAYDFKSGTATLLSPAGREKAALPSRETVYLPEADVVLIQAQTKDKRWLIYDCAKNAWLSVKFAGPDLIGNQSFNNSVGLTYDPNRKLVWAVGQRSEIWVLRLDRAKADVQELK